MPDGRSRRRRVRCFEAARAVVNQTVRDDVPGLAAELAFRFFLALFPFAIFLAALGAFVASLLAIPDPSQRAVQLLGDLLPAEAATLVQRQLQLVIDRQNPGLLSIGALAALFFATGGTNAIIKAMNRAYGVGERRPIWRRYVLAITLTIFAGASIMAAFLLLVPLRMVVPQILADLGLGAVATAAVNVIIAALALVLVVTAASVIYRVAPNIKLPPRSVLPGAVLFAVIWLITTLGFGFYVSNFGDYANTYGALAGVAIVLIWFYVSSLILLVAAEVNEVIHEMADPEDVARRRHDATTDPEQRPTTV
jgi:membrane protein